VGPDRAEEGLERQRELPVWSGALVTAGDVVFYGTMDGWFKALDARSGKLLWQSKLGSGSSGSRSRTAAGRQQYVAILAGCRRLAGRHRGGGHRRARLERRARLRQRDA
jgi:outer membrane protein assembly factor BamB